MHKTLLISDTYGNLDIINKKVTQTNADNEFVNFAELKAIFSSVAKVDDLIVFNTGGNKLRLISYCWVYYERRRTLEKTNAAGG